MSNIEHRETVKRLIKEANITEIQAKIILGIICEEREKAYCTGQINGYNAGVIAGMKNSNREI